VEKSEINDGDTVAAGNTKVRVEIKGRDRRQPISVPAPPPTAAEKLVVPSATNLIARDLPTGIVMYCDPAGGTPVTDVIERLLTRSEPLVIANFRVAGQKPPDWLAAEDDLLAAVPEDMSEELSLYLISPSDIPLPGGSAPPMGAVKQQRAMLLELYHELRPRAAAVLAFTKASKDDVLNATRFRRGFYCSADGLEMFLSMGSKQLAKALVDELHAILIARTGDTSWALYANPVLAPTPAELGLEPETGTAATVS
jgi:hypothetical protein